MYYCLYEVSNSICLANYARHATRFWGNASSSEYAVEFSQKEFASPLLVHPLLESPVSLLSPKMCDMYYGFLPQLT